MNFLSKENPDRWYQLAWLLCVISLPWQDRVNSACLIFLTLLWIIDGSFLHRWHLLKSARWAWPFFLYFLLLLIGLIYSPDLNNALFSLEKKITFFLLPLIAVTGKVLPQSLVRLMKLVFVYSCCAMIMLSLGASTVNYLSGGTAFNFDRSAEEIYNASHPQASSAWMYFSYIQLLRFSELHPAYFSMYLIFALVILCDEKYSSAGKRNSHIVLGLVMSCFIALLSTRMAIVAFVVSALYLIIKHSKEKQRVFLVSAAALTVAFLLWINPVTRFRVFEEPAKTSYQINREASDFNSVSYRLIEWKGSWSVIQSHIFFGAGSGSSSMTMNHFYSNYSNNTAGITYDPHNQYLQTWMELGLIGLFAFLLCVFAPLIRPKIETSHVAFILIFSLMCLTESMAERQKGIVFFTLFQSLFLAFENKPA